MATITRRGMGQWQVKVRRKGYPVQTRTFDTRADAEAWSRGIESQMDRATFVSTTAAEKTSLAQAIDRYKKDVCPSLARGGIAQMANLDRLKENLGATSLATLDSAQISAYREIMLKTYSLQTVRHDMGLLNRVLKCCQIDWGINLPRGLPTANVRLPKMPRARERRLKPGEEERLLTAARQYGGEIADIIIFAIETAMRRNEIAQMRWEQVELRRKVVSLLSEQTKTGEPRQVPLSVKAAEILTKRNVDIGPVWRITPNAITTAFMRVTGRAGLDDLRFHDLRHEATSRLFEKGLNMMEVAEVTGHKTLEMLKRYTHLNAESLAVKLM
ncbi:integrase family protein [Desulfovibrio sp. X2]|uniref:integrase n=1 Tax=Desulfovibrio sp. X2 TaxID=941449 RepID=UPI000358D0A9|nr:site-specific integrase [Desulfovibrio sp. X2]EPR43551.1 integrase family protein [Desulfovibrio sp. X2]